MATIIQRTLEKHPNLPVLFANTAVSKVIQLIDSRFLSPAFKREKTIEEIQSWPNQVKTGAEWLLYFLSGAIRTMPDSKNPISIVMKEALAETINHSGMKIAEIPEKEQEEIMSLALPEMRRELTEKVKTDHKFRDALYAIFGKSQEWNKILRNANDFLSQRSEEIKTHREARKIRGWRRFFV